MVNKSCFWRVTDCVKLSKTFENNARLRTSYTYIYYVELFILEQSLISLAQTADQ